MQPCIVLDSNIWISNLLLRTPICSALIYGIVQEKGKICLPDVVGREIAFHTERRGLEILNNALTNITKLSYFDDGAKSAINDLPDKEKISRALLNRLGELGDIIFRHEHTLPEMEQALDMVYRNLPPNFEKNQQYKDSLLWQVVLSLANKYSVHFVTRDKGFFKNRKYEEGPADNIREDIKSKGNRITIYTELASCAKILHSFKKPIDDQTIIDNIFQAAIDDLKKEAKENGYVLKDLESGQLKPFITSDPSKIAVKFRIKCNISEREDYEPLFSWPTFPELKGHHESEDTIKSYTEFEGHCLVSIENNEISDLDVKTTTWSGKWGLSTSGSIGIPRWPKNGPQIYGEIDWG